jgi:signal peptidase I
MRAACRIATHIESNTMKGGESKNITGQLNKKRRPFLAAILSLIVPGLGQIYNTHAKRGIVIYIIVISFHIISLIIFTRPPVSQEILWAIFVVVGLMWLFRLTIVADAALGAWRMKIAPLHKYNRLLVYVGIAVIGFSMEALIYGYIPTASVWENYSIKSASMLPSLGPGDYVASWRDYYKEHDPEIGDIAVFDLPTDPATHYMKRVIGLPGDRVQIIDSVLYLNGRAIERELVAGDRERIFFGESLLFKEYVEILPNGRQYRTYEKDTGSVDDNSPEYIVPPDHYFTLGDNRDHSLDSRLQKIGFVPRENFQHLPTIIFWSDDLNRIGYIVQQAH